MILEGRILLFDTVNKNRDVFFKDCKIDIPEKVPLTWDFNHEKIIGLANVTKDDKGLVAIAETFSNEMIGVEDLSSIFEDGKIGAGGFYTNVKKHNDGSFIVVDEAKLREVALVLAPVNEEYSFEIVEEEKDDEMYETCKDCPYYYGEINQCMYGEENVPDNLEKKCEVKND